MTVQDEIDKLQCANVLLEKMKADLPNVKARILQQLERITQETVADCNAEFEKCSNIIQQNPSMASDPIADYEQQFNQQSEGIGTMEVAILSKFFCD